MRQVRKAVIDDVPVIHSLIEMFVDAGVMLPRTYDDICTSLRDFFVCEENGEIIGVAALSLVWKGMGEVRSLAVRRDHTLKGTGRALVGACIEEARDLGLKSLFALTYQEEFFKRIGFHVVDKETLPHKIWGDCVNCAKFPACDETAVVMELTDNKENAA